MLYNPAGVPAGVPEDELTMGQVAGAGWTELGQTEVDPASHAVAAAIVGLSIHGVIAVPEAAGGALPPRPAVLPRPERSPHATVMAAGGPPASPRPRHRPHSDPACV